MKEKFKECMAYMWPDGIASHQQLRDVIQVFAMAWAKAYDGQCIPLGRETEAILAQIANPEWWPDHTWDWTMG